MAKMAIRIEGSLKAKSFKPNNTCLMNLAKIAKVAYLDSLYLDQKFVENFYSGASLWKYLHIEPNQSPLME